MPVRQLFAENLAGTESCSRRARGRARQPLMFLLFRPAAATLRCRINSDCNDNVHSSPHRRSTVYQALQEMTSDMSQGLAPASERLCRLLRHWHIHHHRNPVWIFAVSPEGCSPCVVGKLNPYRWQFGQLRKFRNDIGEVPPGPLWALKPASPGRPSGTSRSKACAGEPMV